MSLAEKLLYESLMVQGAVPVLLAELVRPPGWHAGAACHDHPGINFFPDAGEPTEAALRVCLGCTVRVQCLEAGLRGNERGIWGGTSYRHRSRLRRVAGMPGEDGPARRDEPAGRAVP